ncbi:MAG: GNAT family N-acetyltransferase [Proteobacteria bacterium]|nr:GNAT family N-acetyltransferase [Pseudomonadota bacterium]
MNKTIAFNIQNHFHLLEDHFSSSISINKHVLADGFIAYLGGIDEAKFNVLLQRQPHPQPEQLISDAKEFFNKKNNIPSWVYVVPKDLDTPALQNALKNHGLVFDEASTVMYCPLSNPVQSAVEPEVPLIIQLADVNKTGWLQIMKDAFGGTDETISQYAQALDRAKAKGTNMQHFLGTQEGQPVSAITLTFLDDGVRIDNVSTTPTHQRQGYSTQMVQFAMNLAHALGHKHCVLEASADGLSVYQRLGLAEIFIYHVYVA